MNHMTDLGSWDMTVSIWWVLWAFIAGGYAGALVVGLMAVTGGRRETPSSGRGAVVQRRRTTRHVHHSAEMYGSV